MSPIGIACPVPATTHDRIQLGHGSGGKMSARLFADHVLPHFSNPLLDRLGDGAILPATASDLVVSTDTFVVNPLEFPGGNIGDLAINGTLNDVAMMGGRPAYLTVGFVLEEGLEMEVLRRVLESMATAANRAGVPIVAGDTKVVERGKADGLFVNTTGIGVLSEFRPGPERAAVGDAVLVSGPIARHGMAIMAARESLAFDAEISSDTANLVPLVESLRAEVGPAVHALRDPTRGGVASALNEFAKSSHRGITLDETRLPVPEPVRGACEMLGLDPLFVANEGILLALVAEDAAEHALAVLRAHPLGEGAMNIGGVVDAHPGMVTIRTGLGGTRVLEMLPGDQLPRIC